MFGTRIGLVLASQSTARGGSVAGGPKDHGSDSHMRLHTMTVLLEFTRCSPTCLSYIIHSLVCLSFSYNQLTHSLQQLRHGPSCICNRQAPGHQHVEQRAVYQCKRLADSQLGNTMHCEIISSSHTLVDNRDILKHRNAAKQHLVHSIGGIHKGDHGGGMLKQRPTLHITRSNRYQVHAHVDNVKSHFIQSARDNIPEFYDRQCIEAVTVRLEFIDSPLADNRYLFPIAECVEDGVHGPNAMQAELQAAIKWLVSTIVPAGSNPAV